MRNLKSLCLFLACLGVSSVLPAVEPKPMGDEPAVGVKKTPPGLFPTGLVMPESMRQIKPGSLSVPQRRNAPFAATDPAFDWTTYGALTPVRNQGITNTCWVFAGIGETESKVVMQDGVLPSSVDYSEQDMTNYFPDGAANGGNQFMASSFLGINGAANESSAPWLNTMTPQAFNSSLPRVKRLKNMIYLGNLSGTSAANINAIKSALTHGPVVTGMSVTKCREWAATMGHPLDDFYWGSEVVPASFPSTGTDHEVVIVGWDDNKVQSGGLATGAWKIRNSWGSFWGTGGYSWIGYGAASVGEGISYVPDDGIEVHDSSVTMLARDLAWFGSFGLGNLTTVYALAHHTVPSLPAGNHELYAVDLAICVPNTTYQVELYSGFNGTAPSGLLATKTGTVTNAGYYSINLDTPVPVVSGQSAVMKIRLSTPTAQNFQYAQAWSAWSQNVDNVYYYSTTGNNGSWTDVHDDAYAFTVELVYRARVRPVSSSVQEWQGY